MYTVYERLSCIFIVATFSCCNVLYNESLLAVRYFSTSASQSKCDSPPAPHTAPEVTLATLHIYGTCVCVCVCLHENTGHVLHYHGSFDHLGIGDPTARNKCKKKYRASVSLNGGTQKCLVPQRTTGSWRTLLSDLASAILLRFENDRELSLLSSLQFKQTVPYWLFYSDRGLFFGWEAPTARQLHSTAHAVVG